MSKSGLISAKASYVFLLLVCASLPFAILVNSYLTIITVASCVFYALATGLEKREASKYYLLLMVLYLVNLLAFFNSQNFKSVFTDLEQKLPLLAFPIIFLLGPKLNGTKIRIILITFVCSVAIVCLLSFRNGFYWGYLDERLYNNLLIRHPYLGMYCVLSFFFCLEILSETIHKYFRLFFVLLALFYFFFLVVLFAKMSLVTFLVLLLLYVLLRLYYNQKKKLIILILSILALTFVYATCINQRGKEFTSKVISFSNFDFTKYDPTIVNSLNLRMIHWSCSIDVLFSQEIWLWGAGTGDAQVLLNECYANKINDQSVLIKDNFNSHNQFFTLWLHVGIVPLLFFLFHFIVILSLYIKNKDLLAIVFTVGILFFCITESIFEVQKGIVFYCLFQSIFLYRQFMRNELLTNLN